MIRVLLVEDDIEMARTIKYYLGKEESYDIVVAGSVAEARDAMLDYFDIILLDVMLPDGDGLNLCAQIREIHDCPILFVSCLSDSGTIIDALNRGGDDYITKPFENGVLQARLQANLRRYQMEQSVKTGVNQYGDLTLDAKNYRAIRGDKSIPLYHMEYRILSFLMQNRGKCFSSEEIYKHLWGQSSFGDNRTVVVHIYNIRKKLEINPKEPKYIRSVWGRGYCFDPDGDVRER